jgi:hypothetical protein
LITGTAVSQGKYADGKDICEIYIHKKNSDALPHKYGNKELISLDIGNITYEDGVHETQKGVVWISSVLYKKGPRKEKARLVDALEIIGLKKGDRIRIRRNIDGTFSLEPYRPA